ncbi:MAG: PIN domain-containing protein [Devosia sp.]|nr:PIN domain-containing protein [Devosia sp.]
MIADCFLDTNVLIYAAIGHRREPQKYERAVRLIETVDYSTSAQVLAEFYVNVTRDADLPLTPAKAAEWVATITLKPCQDVDSGIVMRGIENAQRFQISYWDGAIIAAAERLGVETLYTEDLNHGQSYGSVRVVNPFRQN